MKYTFLMQTTKLQSIKQMLSRYKKFAFLFFLLFGIPLSLFLLLIRPQPGQKTPTIAPSSQPTISPFVSDERFVVLETSPVNGETNVDSGEITISFTTNVPITSDKSFSLDITPALPYYWKFTNTFPTKTVKTQVYGGLTPTTQYFVTVKDADNLPVFTWNFTTSDDIPDSSTGFVIDQEKEEIRKYYPLFDYVPYNSPAFFLDYIDRLSIVVKIKNKNIEQVKKEVFGWIKGKDVDPATHNIRYENAF